MTTSTVRGGIAKTLYEGDDALTTKPVMHTVNVDIFTCIHFHGFMKMGNFTCIKIRVLSITGS